MIYEVRGTNYDIFLRVKVEILILAFLHEMKIVSSTNSLYLPVHRSPDTGHPTSDIGHTTINLPSPIFLLFNHERLRYQFWQ